MTLKEYLTQAVRLNKAIDSAILSLEEWKNFGLKSRSYLKASKDNGYGRSSGVEKTVAKIMKAEERLNRDIDRYVDLQNEVRDLIATLENHEERSVLERHYLLGRTWDAVAEECFVSLRTVHYLHNKALKKLEPYYLARTKKAG